jgi:hypothetical protein
MTEIPSDRSFISKTEKSLSAALCFNFQFLLEDRDAWIRRNEVLEKLMIRFRIKVGSAKTIRDAHITCSTVDHITRAVMSIYGKLKGGSIWTPCPHDQADNVKKLAILMDRIARITL